MRYRKLKGYRFELADDVLVELRGEYGDVVSEFYTLGGRRLFIKKGYQWDGASGPTIDTSSTMLAALVHDVLYQMMRAGQLTSDARVDADMELYVLMRARGVAEALKRESSCMRVWADVRALYFFGAVRIFGAGSARPRPGRREQQEIIYEV